MKFKTINRTLSTKYRSGKTEEDNSNDSNNQLYVLIVGKRVTKLRRENVRREEHLAINAMFGNTLLENAGQSHRIRNLDQKHVRNVDDIDWGENNLSFALDSYSNSGKIKVTIGNVEIKMLIDTESSCSVNSTWTHIKSAQLFKCLSKSRPEKEIYAYAPEKPFNVLGFF